VIISSGCGRLFVIIGPPFPKHSAGPVQMGRLKLYCSNGCVEFDSICVLINPYGQFGLNALDHFTKNCRVTMGIILDKSVL